MGKRKTLSSKQTAVINDLFAGELDEGQVLGKHKISRNVYNKWLSSSGFVEELNRRIESLTFQSRILIARYSSLAAAKLIELTESKSQETARKACLDIISLPKADKQDQQEQDLNEDSSAEQLSQGATSKILAVLAEESGAGNNKTEK